MANDAYQNALGQMLDYGLEISEIVADGRFHHVRVEGNKGSKKSGWYICQEIRLRNGDLALVGAFGNYKIGDEHQAIKLAGLKLSPQERQEFDGARKVLAERTREERAKTAARAAKLAPELFGWAREDRASPYLARKKVAAMGVRVDRHGNVVVPVRNWDGAMIGLQFIPPDGKGKKFLTGTPKTGAFHLIGSLEGNGPVLVAEGYATAASCAMATRWPALVCFDVGNIEVVAVALRERYPLRPLVIAADNDHERINAQSGKPENIGRIKGKAAAKKINAHLALPTFHRGKGLSDFNDLHTTDGLDRVAEQLRKALECEPEGGDAPISPPPAGDGAGVDFSLGALLQRYTLVYGTLTVYDHLQRKLIGLSELRAAAGNKMVTRWQKHPERRMVNAEDVVFDPTESCGAHQVNLFRGMPLSPKEGDCRLLMELLHYLCGESDAVFDWVLKWIAYPLQHVGAKMQTAVIFHGPEGTGKNMFWSVVRRMYGSYGVIITQNQLEGRFNGWASSKLFIIGNEVVPRQELYASKGIIKNMITEPEWQIEEKHMPARTEANHANVVFLSNVLQPVTPDPDDRRYMVIWTPEPKPADFYTQLGKEIANGGTEAFCHALMTMDLGDFNEHSKALPTEAKDRLIEISMDTPERFWRQWSAGDLKYPYLPAPTMEVYAVYKSWCERRGERPLREVVFVSQVHRRMYKLKKHYLDDRSGSSTQRWLFLPHEWRCPANKSEAAALGEAITFFRGTESGEQHAR